MFSTCSRNFRVFKQKKYIFLTLIIITISFFLFPLQTTPTYALTGNTVGTSSVPPLYNGGITSRSYQHKTFYANTLFWAFYYDGTNIVYSTSSNGSIWSYPTAVRSVGNGEAFSIYFDGTYISYAVTPTYGTSDTIYYRCGTPNNNGVIIWLAPEQIVGSASYTLAVSIGVDSSGFPYIAYRAQSPRYCFVTKSSTNNGTWTTTSGYPLKLNNASGYWTPIVIPLTNNKMYIVYNNGSGIFGKLYNGVSWGTQETITLDSTSDVWPISAVAEGDNVHLVYLQQTTFNIKYIKRTYSSSSWGNNTIVQYSTTDLSCPVLTINSSTLFVFWAGSPNANHIYFKECVAGMWDTNPTDWLDESSETLIRNDCLTGFYQAYGNRIGLLYATEASNPHNVKFAYISTLGKRFSSTSLTLSTNSQTSYLGFKINLNGTLEGNEEGLGGLPIVLSYSVTGGQTWNDLTSVMTSFDGSYSAVWIPSVTGTYLIRATWAGNITFPSSQVIKTLSVTSFNNQYVFSVSSNSTISALAFNSTSNLLSFTVSGPTNTTGYTDVTIAKALIPDVTGLKVNMDGNQLNYTIKSSDDSWLIHFAYHHSTHSVSISLGTVVVPEFPTALFSLIVLTVLSFVLLLVKKFNVKSNRNHRTHADLKILDFV